MHIFAHQVSKRIKVKEIKEMCQFNYASEYVSKNLLSESVFDDFEFSLLFLHINCSIFCIVHKGLD